MTDESEQPELTAVETSALSAKAITSSGSFKKNFDNIINELDALHRGVFDESEAAPNAALALLTQAGLIKLLGKAELTARALKRDIDFAKADAYYRLRQEKVDGKKLSEAALAQLILRDEDVNRLYHEQNAAEKEARELANLLNILKEAHITFRTIIKKGI